MFFDDKGKVKGNIVPAEKGLTKIGSPAVPVADIQADSATIAALTATALAAPTISGTVAFTGAVTASGGLKTAATTAASGATVAGQLYVGVVDAAFTLPLAASNPGAIITIVTGVASAGTGLTIAPTGSDKIQAMTKASGGTALTDKTTVTNSGASDVVGDCMVLQSDGVSNWRAISIIGTWA